MSFRGFIKKLENNTMIKKIEDEIDLNLGLTGFLKNKTQSYIFENVGGFPDFKIVANLLTDRKHLGIAFDCSEQEVVKKIADAIENPGELNEVDDAPFFEVEAKLSDLPIPRYLPTDGGPYLSSAIVFSKDKELGDNVSFHRMMVKNGRLLIRIVKRHTWEFYERSNRNLDIAICIGVDPAISEAAAVCTDIGVFELPMASAIIGKPIDVVKCRTCDLKVPAKSEIVIEATITEEWDDEGPFLDITRTPDIVRSQPVLKIKKVFHRKNPIFHALLPGGYEHGTVWKTPTEAVMFNEVNKVCECKDVFLSFGGCSRLHGMVKIKKKNKDDALKAIEAAFKAHPSMKHVFIVDEDIDIYDINAVEWALATRFQAKTDLVIKHDLRGSTLDPSSSKTGKTSKLGFDCTIKGDPKEFRKVF